MFPVLFQESHCGISVLEAQDGLVIQDKVWRQCRLPWWQSWEAASWCG